MIPQEPYKWWKGRDRYLNVGLECLNGGVKITMSGVEPATEKSIFLSHEPDLIHMPLDRTCKKSLS